MAAIDLEDRECLSHGIEISSIFHAEINQPLIADAASELLRQIVGEGKMPVRSVLGVSNLPLELPVMLEPTFEVSN